MYYNKESLSSDLIFSTTLNLFVSLMFDYEIELLFELYLTSFDFVNSNYVIRLGDRISTITLVL